MREFIVLIFHAESEIDMNAVDESYGRTVKAFDAGDAAENRFAEWNNEYSLDVFYALVRAVDGEGGWKLFAVRGEPDWKTYAREIA